MRTPALPSPRRRGLVGLTVASLVAAPLAFGFAAPASADVSSKIATFPYSQNWSNPALITVNDNWSGVTGTQGYLGQDITTSSAGVDPQTLTAESLVANDTDVIANQSNPNTNTSGGVAEFDGIPNPTIALQGSATADAPYVAFHLNLTGQTAVSFAFNARDIDGSADDAVQQIAVQYRLGASGAFTNLPAGYIADATTGGTATQVTARNVSLPVAVENQASVFVRVITSNASGSDEWVGIDDVAVTATAGTSALSLTNPGPQSSTVGTPITPVTLTAGGGTTPYTFGATNLPAGLTLATGTGQITGTPTATGTPSVEISVTDNAAATDTKTFVWTVTEPAAPISIAEIQGTGTATTLPSSTPVTTEGVVTAAYPTGGLNGFYIQTPGPDTTPDASDGLFVYGGPTGFATYPTVGDSVRVTGTPGEFANQTQVSASDWTAIGSLGTVTPKTQVAGTNCALPGTACQTVAELDTARELTENELFQPTAPWTVTDVYDGSPDLRANGSNESAFFGELAVVANSSDPLVTPTEIIDAQDTAAINDRKRYNAAHRLILDDGSAWTYSTTVHQNDPFPWFTLNHSVRAGAGITFTKPVVFTQRFSSWRILPPAQVVGAPTGMLEIEQTRPAAPQNVGGDVKLATFNVLNFFPTTGEAYEALSLGTCTYFSDRAGARVTVNSCTNSGPRGAANTVNLERQRDKIVAAINTVDADIVSLEELENSAKFGKPRDFAIDALVTALNVDAGAGTWAAVPSPATLPPLVEQDVIRNGFIYKPASVDLVGDSVVLSDESDTGEAFEDAREPLAQAFKQDGTDDAEAFAVIVNHFKSKGSGTADPFGQGNANNRRVIQAESLVTFADEFKTMRDISRVFLAGDFNAYSAEDPIQVLNAAGYTNLESSSDPDEETYNFDGQVGSLDHVLANAAALADVNAVDIWDINGYESVYYEYARFNTNVTNLYAPNPYRSSDHSPEIVGINTQPVIAGPVDIQILATNDFHGRIANDPFSAAAGAAAMAGAVKSLRGSNPNTVFAAAGDLIGASTFESFIDNDKPTIDALNEAGLEVSAAGNHEFDQGYDDLVNRVMAPYHETTNPQGGAEWEYIAANVKLRANGADALTPSWTKTMAGVKVGFVGAVTEQLPTLVTPAGIAQIQVTDIVTAVNEEADNLRDGGAEIVVMLVHEGSGSTVCGEMTDDPASDFGSIITGANDNVDAIVSGHTHLEYNCSFPVAGWADRDVKERPVVSAGQYGAALNQLVFTVDPATGKILNKSQAVLKMKVSNGGPATFTPDAATAEIVSAAVAKAEVLGARPLGKINGAFNRAKFANGTTENRGGESTLGNLVADIQRWATRNEESGSAQIAFMNAGGLRTDLPGGISGESAYPKTVTYKQAANVQPFANTLVNMSLTGAQIKAVLEQQWQAPGATRPFLKLGMSKGFEYTYDPSKTQGNRIQEMWLNGTAINPATVYSVTVNSFLATGGDGFSALTGGTGKQDTGKTDLQAQVDYFSEFANTAEGDDPLPVDYKQQAVGVKLPADAPADYAIGERVAFDLSSLSMTDPLDLRDSEVSVKMGGTTVGTFPVTTTLSAPGNANSNDEAGTATVSFRVPAVDAGGIYRVTITGATTGTKVTVPVKVQAPTKVASTVTASVSPASIEAHTGTATIAVDVTGAGGTPTGTVAALVGDRVVGGGELVNGKADVVVGPFTNAGTKSITIEYYGDAANLPSETSVQLTVTPAPAVERATPTVGATISPEKVRVGDEEATVSVSVTKTVGVPSGAVLALIDGQVVGAAELVGGKATLTVGPFATAGDKQITVSYFGDASTKAASTTVDLKVKKDKPKIKVRGLRYFTAGTRVKHTVVVGDTDVAITGKLRVVIKAKGKVKFRKKMVLNVRNGVETFRLPKLRKPGRYTMDYTFLGSDVAKKTTTTILLRVRR